MKILILGGSKFLGRAYVLEALARGYEVTTFNRGVSRADQPGVEAVHGDRTSQADLEKLVAGRRWDAVVDTSGQQPHDVARAAGLLRDHADHYTFISSIHAFADWPAAPVDESSPTHPCPADTPPDQPPGNPLKAGCERALLTEFGARSLLLNCGLLIGPHEPVGRLPWWLERIAAGGRVLAPGNPDRPMQLIDARDFAAFGLDLLERGETGRYITTGPAGRDTYGDFLGHCIRATGSDAELVWTDDNTLLAADVGPWVELPLWTPDLPDWHGTWQADSSRALAAGLNSRPLAETVRDTWAWLQETGPGEESWAQGDLPLGIAREKERKILDQAR
ncbi:NAD-dependent epimerase/dehydratase family protein [Kitasatospora sp. MBT63]|uniref:NAD-dependent epimerase/dehydratase family protein n=1 Tax=Kitasatospora sp. MBT63 TaxID=1444768 RepID=UPI00053A5ECB|nr:NAD-dependent epimerase/dehydratase family protein [Kitasatospora sp. MBT63]